VKILHSIKIYKKNSEIFAVTAKCKVCSEIFSDNKIMLDHFLEEHLSKLDPLPCMFCEKDFANFDDLTHHIHLEHQGIDSTLLEKATIARDIKKQVGADVNPDSEGIGFECSRCFEQFSDIDKFLVHSKKEHDREVKPEFIEKMKKVRDTSDNGKVQPICQRCNKTFLAVIFTLIDNKVLNICFNCYEDYFGANALARLTVGTNDDTIKKMRTPLK